MTTSVKSFCLIALAGLVLVAGASGAGDWPTWGGTFQRNMASDETSLPGFFDPGKPKAGSREVDISTTRKVVWAALLGSQTYGNPVVAGGKLIVGTNDANLKDPRVRKTKGGLIICFDADTGKKLWQLVVPRFRTNKSSFNYNIHNLGICNSATIEGDRAYVVSNRGEVLCLDMNGQSDGNAGPFTDEGQYIAGPGKKPVEVEPADGDIIWRFDMITRLPVEPQDASSCAVLIHGDFVYAGSSNGVDESHINVACPDAPSLIVLDKNTGKLVAADDVKIGHRMLHGEWSSPAMGVVGGKTLIFHGGGDGVCYAFEALETAPPDGKVATLKKVWSCDANPHEYRFRPDGTPIPYQRMHGTAKNKIRGEGPSEIIATPVFHKGRIYVTIGQDPRHGTGKGALTCIDAATGKKLWQSRLVERSLSTVSIADGLLYVADYSGSLHCFELETGKRLWVHHTDPDHGKRKFKTGSPLWSSSFAADGKVYLGTEKRELWVFKAGRERKVLARIRLREKMSNTPIAAGGMLYVASGRYLYAVRKLKDTEKREPGTGSR